MPVKRRAKRKNASVRTGAGGRAASVKDGLYLFTILAHPTPKASARLRKRQGGGAYVNCWIDFRLYEGALALAKFYIRKAGWRVRSLEEHRWIRGRADVSRGSVYFFREAKRDGASLVFHSYPPPPRTRARKSAGDHYSSRRRGS
jgi:hypothetical protein